MAKSRALEETLAMLHRLREQPTSATTLATLRQVLAGKSSHAAAKAAQIAGEFEIVTLTPDLVAAFARFMVNPVKGDPTCAAKVAIADALYRIGADAEAVFLPGIHHVQLEPVYGGKADTAGPLRGVCALGLVRMNYADTLTELADLLADPEGAVRIAAARALAYSENEHGAPLLRLKVLIGDEQPEVVAECLTALLQLAPAASLPFVARRLDASDAPTCEMAALALGTARRREALDILRQWFARLRDAELRRTALLAIAMLKHDEAIDFLLAVTAEAIGPTARDAIAALGMYRHDGALRQRVIDTATRRDDVDLRAAVAEAFD